MYALHAVAVVARKALFDPDVVDEHRTFTTAPDNEASVESGDISSTVCCASLQVPEKCEKVRNLYYVEARNGSFPCILNGLSRTDKSRLVRTMLLFFSHSRRVYCDNLSILDFDFDVLLFRALTLSNVSMTIKCAMNVA